MGVTANGDVVVEVSADASQLVAEMRTAQAAQAAMAAEGVEAGAKITAAQRTAAAETKRAAKEAEAAVRASARASAAAVQQSAREQAASVRRATTEQAAAVRASAAASKAAIGQTTAGVGQLGQQLADVGVQLQMGTSPFTILIQQGPQVASALSMVGAAAVKAALAATLLNPVVMGTVAALGAVGLAWYTASQESEKFTATVNANRDALNEAADALRAADRATRDIQGSFEVATGAVSPLITEIANAQQKVDDAFAETQRLQNENLGTIKQQVGTLTSQRDAILKGSTGWHKYNDEIKALQPQLAAAQKAYDETTAKVGELKDQVEATAVAHDRDRRAKEEAAAAADALRAAEERLRKEKAAQKKIIDDTFAAAKGEIDRRRAVEAGIDDLNEAAEASAMAQLSAEDRIQAELTQTLAGIEAKAAALRMVASTSETERINTAATDAEVEATEAAMAQIRALREEEAKKQAEDLRKAEAAQRQSALAVAGYVADGLGMVGDAASEMEQRRVDIALRLEESLAASEEYLTDEQKAALEERIEEQKKAARKAFRVAQNLRAAEALVNTAAAVVSALANPPGPPYSAPQAVAAGAAGAVQVAAIEAQSPAFHSGGAADDVTARMQQDEVGVRLLRKELGAVLNPTGAAMVGNQAVRSANAGIAPTGGGPTVVYQVYDRRIIDRVNVDTIRQGGRFDGYIRKQRSTPYGFRS